MVGVCTSGGNTAYLGASEPRLKALATVAAFLPGPDLYNMMNGEEALAERKRDSALSRRKYEKTGGNNYSGTKTAQHRSDKQAIANESWPLSDGAGEHARGIKDQPNPIASRFGSHGQLAARSGFPAQRPDGRRATCSSGSRTRGR